MSNLLDSYNSTYSSGCSSSCSTGWLFLGMVFVVVIIAIMFVIAKKIGEYALKNGLNGTLWGILGFFFGLIALLALHTGIVAMRNRHSFTCWCLLGFFLGLTGLVSLHAGMIAERKNYDFATFCLLGASIGVFMLLIVSFLPAPKITVSANEVDQTCEEEPKEEGSKLLNSAKYVQNEKTNKKNEHWICKCGQKNVGEAKRCINCFAEKP